jgi:hypothetical protein
MGLEEAFVLFGGMALFIYLSFLPVLFIGRLWLRPYARCWRSPPGGKCAAGLFCGMSGGQRRAPGIAGPCVPGGGRDGGGSGARH